MQILIKFTIFEKRGGILLKKLMFGLFCCFYNFALAGSAGSVYDFESQELVLNPTAGMIYNSYLININFFSNPLATTFSLHRSINKQLMIGTSITIQNFFGQDNPKIVRLPSLISKYRLMGESTYLPAIATGINTEIIEAKSYDGLKKSFHSVGAFVVLSKSFAWNYGYFGLHTGLNFPIEFNKDQKLDFFVGMEHSINKNSSLVLEYDFWGNDNSTGKISNGLTNLAFKYSVAKSTNLEFKIYDVFQNQLQMLRTFNIQFLYNFN